LCPSSGGQNCITQHLASSHSAGGRPMHRLGEDCDTVWYNFDLLMMGTILLETCRVV